MPEEVISKDFQEPHRQVAIYMAGVAAAQPTATGNNGGSGSGKTPAQAMADLVAEMYKLTAVAVTAENQEEVNVELEKFTKEMTKIQREIEVEATRTANQQA